jgi:hypothetical protein
MGIPTAEVSGRPKAAISGFGKANFLRQSFFRALTTESLELIDCRLPRAIASAGIHIAWIQGDIRNLRVLTDIVIRSLAAWTQIAVIGCGIGCGGAGGRRAG